MSMTEEISLQDSTSLVVLYLPADAEGVSAQTGVKLFTESVNERLLYYNLWMLYISCKN